MNDDEAWAKVRSARVGRLATVTPSDRPHVVPFVFALLERGADHVVYWAVDHKPKRSAEPPADPQHPDETVRGVRRGRLRRGWERLWWVRCSGTARLVDDDAERHTALDALAAKYPQYVVEPPDGPVVAIDVQHIHSWESAPPS